MNTSIPIAGLDPGKRQDPAAMSIWKISSRPNPFQSGALENIYELGFVHRWPLGTHYGVMVRDVIATMEDPRIPGCSLAFDVGGPGEPVYDWFRDSVPGSWLRPLCITGGTGIKFEDGRWRVGKVQIGSLLVTLFESGRVAITPECRATDECKVLLRQVASFKEKINKNMTESFDSIRDDTGHADIAMSCAIALWIGERGLMAWDGSLGLPQSHSDGMSVLSTAPGGVFASGNREFSNQPRPKINPHRLDANGIPDGYVPPWGPTHW